MDPLVNIGTLWWGEESVLNHKGVDMAVDFIYITFPRIYTYRPPEYRNVQKIKHTGLRAF